MRPDSHGYNSVREAMLSFRYQKRFLQFRSRAWGYLERVFKGDWHWDLGPVCPAVESMTHIKLLMPFHMPPAATV